jgi:secretion/DNA translocation related TadE-like protein
VKKIAGDPYGEQGSASVLMVAALLAACVIAGLAMWMGAVVNVRTHVSGAADLVALSAANAQRDALPPCQAAKEVALENQVELIDCTTSGDAFDFAVSVTVGQRLAIFGNDFPVSQTAHAGWLCE